MTEMKDILSLRATIARILTPLVRILLRHGIAYGTFAEIAREVYARVAMKDFAIQDRKQSISRISVITGLNRKAVKKILERPEENNDGHAESYNRAARVIAGWRRDTEFQDAAGRPGVLPLDGKDGSFRSLVKKYSGDMPIRAVLDELSRVGNVEKLDDGHVRLVARAYLPSTDIGMKLHILGVDAARLIGTIEHNLQAAPKEARLQRTVAYDNLPAEALSPFHSLAAEQSQALLEKLDSYLSARDRDNHPDIGGTGRYAAGVGIFIFEESVSHES